MTMAGKAILFVDQDHQNFNDFHALLSAIPEGDYKAEHCDDLARALPMILSETFDVVLLDYHWDTHRVEDILSLLQSQTAQVPPVIVMMKEACPDIDASVIGAGAADCFVKSQLTAESLARGLRHTLARRQSQQRLAHLAHYDALTKIPNRLLFRDRLEHVLKLSERQQEGFSLLFIDLNGFKAVNDSFGHDIGDAVIRICAERLVTCLRKSDSVARMGGDEFTLLLPHTESYHDIATITEKVIDLINEPVSVGGYEIVVGCSIGVATYPEAGEDADTLMKSADLAMYRAKQQGNNRICFFNESLHQDIKRQLRLESDLRIALKLQQFELRYTPRVEVATKQLRAFEVQLYWNKPGEGLIHSNEFMHTAEEIGIVHALGFWMLRRVCEDLKPLRQIYGDDFLMSIDCSLKLFRHEPLVEEIAVIFSEQDILPGQIEFELSETLMADNIDQVGLSMRPLAFFGINFLLNNFGSGNSSFLHLIRLPITGVKIDAAVFVELTRSLHEKRLVPAMLKLAHALGKQVVIDGVDTDEQLQWLNMIGCDQVQGLSIAPPLSLEALLSSPFSPSSSVS